MFKNHYVCKGKNLFLNLQDNALVFFCPECKLVTIFLARGVGDVQIVCK